MSELMLVGVFFPDPVEVKSLKVYMMTSTMKHYVLKLVLMILGPFSRLQGNLHPYFLSVLIWC